MNASCIYTLKNIRKAILLNVFLSLACVIKGTNPPLVYLDINKSNI